MFSFPDQCVAHISRASSCANAIAPAIGNATSAYPFSEAKIPVENLLDGVWIHSYDKLSVVYPFLS